MRITIPVVLRVLAMFWLLSGCALLRGSTSVTPGTGKGTAYPCGYVGMQCTDTSPATCCNYGVCADDGAPYCDERGPSDPSDPVTWGAKRVRGERTPSPE